MILGFRFGRFGLEVEVKVFGCRASGFEGLGFMGAFGSVSWSSGYSMKY